MFSLTLLVACAVVADAVLNHPCQTGLDCDEDECCAVQLPLKRKIQRFSPKCLKLGKEKDDCYVQYHLSPSVKQYVDLCPCDYGFFCASTGIFEIPNGEHGECTPNKLVGKRQERQLCQSRADCTADELCASGLCEKLG